MKIGIFGNDYQMGKQSSIKSLFDYLQKKEADIWIDKDFYHYLSDRFAFTPQKKGFIFPHSIEIEFDMIFSLGGDGTFLHSAAWVGSKNIPILGINTGRLGFLADTNTSEMIETLDEIFQEKYLIEERSLFQVESSVLFHGPYNYALNEIAVLKRDTSSMITIHTYLNDIFLTKYLADGLVLATPSGSTAYNLSINGPILIPQAKNFVLSPVAPHSLNVRPLVIPDDYIIRFLVESRNKNFLISLDGRSEVFPSGSEFRAKKADFTIKVVKRLNRNFHQTLREKLLWGTDVREEKQKK